MNKRLAAAAVALSAAAATQASASVLYEQFNYSTGDLGTVSSPTWTPSSTGTGDVQVVSGNLQYTDSNPAYAAIVGTPAGNMAELSNQRGKVDRYATSPLPVSTGSLFYSLLLKVTDLTNATTSGGFLAGFNNGAATATTAITQAGARLQIRRSLTDSAKFNFGIRADISASTGTSTLVWDSTDRTVGDTFFVVGQYEFVQSGNTNDYARLWINPADTDLGAALPPVTALESTNGDINQLQIQNFFLRQVSGAALPRGVQIDEIRLDTTWEGVTTVPEPASALVMGLGAAGLFVRRRRD